MSDAAASGSETSSVIGRTNPKKTTADLRKKLLTTAANGTNGHISLHKSDGTTDEGQNKDSFKNITISNLNEDTWITASPVPWPANSAPVTRNPDLAKRTPLRSPEMMSDDGSEISAKSMPRYNFFCSQPFYGFIRLFHVSFYQRDLPLTRKIDFFTITDAVSSTHYLEIRGFTAC